MPNQNIVTKEHIHNLLQTAEREVFTSFGKVTIVVLKLKNGFTLVESSGCVDPKNYDEAYGAQICLDKMEDQLWKLEGYLLQNKLFDEGVL
jgi:hypothetical protein